MATPTDLYRGTTGVALPPEVASTIWQTTQEQSAVIRASQHIPLPGAGIQVPLITGDAQAEWVGETVERKVSRPSLANKVMQSSTLAVIVPFSNQFRRDLAGLYNAIVGRLPLALAKKFDQTVFGLPTGAPSSVFDTLGNATAVGIAGKTWNGLVAAQTAIATGTADGDLDGWVLSPAGRAVLNGATDLQGRPLFITSPTAQGSVTEMLAAPIYKSRASFLADADGPGASTDKQYGYAGDWSHAFWGSVEGVNISIADQATLTDSDGTTINLFQKSMFAVKAEIEIGFRVHDLGYFAKLTSAVQS